jgi:hypothetical protein
MSSALNFMTLLGLTDNWLDAVAVKVIPEHGANS